eukprot:31093-Pelagococcus_subviridis.AAC.2
MVFVCSLSTSHVTRGAACGAIVGRCTTGFSTGCPGAGEHVSNVFAIDSATPSRSGKSPTTTTAIRSGRYHFL